MRIPIRGGDAAVEEAAAMSAACPSCHTTDAMMTAGALAAGAGWRCGRCGQQWTASRIATVAAYAVWVAGRHAVGTTHAEGGR